MHKIKRKKKKGEFITIDGYILKRDISHPYNRSGYIEKHRVIMELWLRKHAPLNYLLIEIDDQLYLRKKFVVHHIDGNKENNNIINLCIMTRSPHCKYHYKLMGGLNKYHKNIKFSYEKLTKKDKEYIVKHTEINYKILAKKFNIGPTYVFSLRRRYKQKKLKHQTRCTK